MDLTTILVGMGGLFLIITVLGIAFYLGKRKGTPSISEMLEGAVDVAERFREKAELGETVNKDFVYGFSKKGTVIREKSLDVEIPKSSEFSDKIKEELGFSISDYLERLKIDKDNSVVSHRLMIVRDKDGLLYRAFSKFLGGPSTRVVFIPEDVIRWEDDDKVVLNDVDLEPDGDGVWTPSFLSSSLGYQKVAYQDLWSVLLSMMSENMRHIQHFNIKHSQDVEKLELMDRDQYGGGVAGDVNKFNKN